MSFVKLKTYLLRFLQQKIVNKQKTYEFKIPERIFKFFLSNNKNKIFVNAGSLFYYNFILKLLYSF